MSARSPRDWSFELVRVGLCAVVGVAGEVAFYTLVREGRRLPILGRLLFSFNWQVDPRLGLDRVWSAPSQLLFGQCSLWMVPVYVAACLYIVRPLDRVMGPRWPWPVRALAFGLAITLWEGLSGTVLHRGLGYAVWSYRDAGALFGGETSYRILPLWSLVGLAAARWARELDDPAWITAWQTRWQRPS